MKDNDNATPHPVDISRRDSFRSLGRLSASVLGASVLSGAPIAPAMAGEVCVMTPVGREGPFYLNLSKIRTDLREDRQGIRLDLKLKLIDLATCVPYKNAAVDIWHCGADGVYSGYTNVNPDVPAYTPVPLGQVPPEAPHYPAGDALTWLRGTQVTNTEGEVHFKTIYPSWYATRTPHVHVKVYLSIPTTGQTAVFTAQLYFDEAVNSVVLSQSAYGGRSVARDTVNATDRHFVAMGGTQNTLRLSKTVYGYEGRHVLGVTLS